MPRSSSVPSPSSMTGVSIVNLVKKFGSTVAVAGVDLWIEVRIAVLPPRPVRLRQDDVAANDRGLRDPELGHDPVR